jgi:hypothetical protein
VAEDLVILMSDDKGAASGVRGAKTMPTEFQEFLRQKSEGTDIRERNRNRGEWLKAVQGLLSKIEDWLRAADTENLLEIMRYEVERVEDRLGVYDAPALKIRFGTDLVDVLPVGRYAIGPFSARAIKSLSGVEGTDGPAAGRVDITNGERKYLLIRDISSGEERWHAVNERSEVASFDRVHLEMILQDLWS